MHMIMIIAKLIARGSSHPIPFSAAAISVENLIDAPAYIDPSKIKNSVTARKRIWLRTGCPNIRKLAM
jgi:hypothetical protein